MKTQISTNKAPGAIGPYSQAVSFDKLVFTSGQIPIDPATGELVPGGIKEQTIRVFENIKAVLDEAGLTFGDIIKTTVFLKDINDFAAMNAVYADYIKDCVLPARSAVQIGALPKGALVEIETVCVRQK